MTLAANFNFNLEGTRDYIGPDGAPVIDEDTGLTKYRPEVFTLRDALQIAVSNNPDTIINYEELSKVTENTPHLFRDNAKELTESRGVSGGQDAGNAGSYALVPTNIEIAAARFVETYRT